jgi:hypothetical protein
MFRYITNMFSKEDCNMDFYGFRSFRNVKTCCAVISASYVLINVRLYCISPNDINRVQLSCKSLEYVQEPGSGPGTRHKMYNAIL